MDQLRFEAGLGHYSVSVAPDSVWISKGMGTHYFQIQLQIGIPEVASVAGRLLFLETTLYAPEGGGPRVPLASASVSVPFNPEGEVRRPVLQYLITNAQLLALEQRRTGDLRLELQVPGRPAPGGLGLSRCFRGHRAPHHRREQVAAAACGARPHPRRGDDDPVS